MKAFKSVCLAAFGKIGNQMRDYFIDIETRVANGDMGLIPELAKNYNKRTGTTDGGIAAAAEGTKQFDKDNGTKTTATFNTVPATEGDNEVADGDGDMDDLPYGTELPMGERAGVPETDTDSIYRFAMSKLNDEKVNGNVMKLMCMRSNETPITERFKLEMEMETKRMEFENKRGERELKRMDIEAKRAEKERELKRAEMEADTERAKNTETIQSETLKKKAEIAANVATKKLEVEASKVKVEERKQEMLHERQMAKETEVTKREELRLKRAEATRDTVHKVASATVTNARTAKGRPIPFDSSSGTQWVRPRMSNPSARRVTREPESDLF